LTSFNIQENRRERASGPVSFIRSQIILFQSRKKFALLYCLATVTGFFSLPGAFSALLSSGPESLAVVGSTLALPLASLLITAGTYILNDLADAELDRANGKKRPIPSGLVSRRQAWAFVALTFGTAVLLAIATFSPVGIAIVAMMLAIGITYSSPKIALMKRFVVKTVSIAIFYNLCALLGMTAYSLDFAMDNPVQVVTILLTLAIAVFISSTLNDMGDVDGDKAAGRRTIPIVIGKDNTIKLTMVLAASIVAANWILYGIDVAADGRGGLVTAIMTSIFALAIAAIMSKMRKGLRDAESMRKQHKKLFPLQMGLHPILIAGVLML
jgi:geranylgeranylglycerol-phosphate geranylgeranyltransferase